jgi:predicted nucleic acid-binding protein
MLDTNVLIDYFFEDRDEHPIVYDCMHSAFLAGDDVCATTLSCKDLYYIISRRVSEAAARDCLESIFFSMELLSVDNRVAYEAHHCSEPDFEDAIIRKCAELNRVDFLVTRDANAFKDTTVRKVTPSELLALLNRATQDFKTGVPRGS